MQANSETLTVSVVVPVYNGAEQIGDCIDALLRQDFPRDRYEIIIVNNRSTDTTQEVIDRYPVRTLCESIRGPAAARNTGIRASTAELIAFTDADCIPQHDWLHRLVGVFSVEIAGAGGSIVSYYKDAALSCYIDRFIFRQRYNILQKSPPHITTANACYRRKELLDIGLFDESFPYAAGEDRDIGERLSLVGKKFAYAEEAIVLHKHPQTLESFYNQRFRHASGQFYANLKKQDRQSFIQLLRGIDSGKLIRLASRFLFSRISKLERLQLLLHLIDSGAYTNGLIWHHLIHLCKKR